MAASASHSRAPFVITPMSAGGWPDRICWFVTLASRRKLNVLVIDADFRNPTFVSPPAEARERIAAEFDLGEQEEQLQLERGAVAALVEGLEEGVGRPVLEHRVGVEPLGQLLHHRGLAHADGSLHRDVVGWHQTAASTGVQGRTDTQYGGSGTGDPSVRGEGQVGNNFLIDGISARDPETNGYVRKDPATVLAQVQETS